jgi:hypothetical protein
MLLTGDSVVTVLPPDIRGLLVLAVPDFAMVQLLLLDRC